MALKVKNLKKKVRGTEDRPRLCVFRSNKHIYAQVVDDVNGRILYSSSTLDPQLRDQIKSPATCEAAEVVGQAIGKKCVEAGLSSLVFDRNGKIYHGRLKALGDSARNSGLIF
jgi:large subunit ribosomal protein L18